MRILKFINSNLLLFYLEARQLIKYSFICVTIWPIQELNLIKFYLAGIKLTDQQVLKYEWLDSVAYWKFVLKLTAVTVRYFSTVHVCIH